MSRSFPFAGKLSSRLQPTAPASIARPNGFANDFRRVAIATFQIDRHRKIGRADDPAQIVDRQSERHVLAIGEAIGIGDRPAARRDRLGTTRGHGLGAARIPDIEEDERLSGDMQRPELLGLARLIAMLSPD